MTQYSWVWGGTAVGHATLAPYDDDEWTDMWRKLFQTDRTVQGVFYGYGSALAVSHPSGSTIRVASGLALVDGKIYENTANVDNTVATPGSGNNYYTIVLRKSWAAQTIVIAVLGPDVSAPPAVDQTDGTTWEIELATVQVTSAGVITVTDARTYVHFDSRVSHTMLDDDAVYDNNIGYRVPKIVRRVGDSSTDWSQAGSSAFVPTDIKEIVGSVGVVGGDTVTFPENFSYPPLVFLTAYPDTNIWTGRIIVGVASVTTSGFVVRCEDENGNNKYSRLFYRAIGPG